LIVTYIQLSAGRWFSTGTPVSSTNKTDHHNIAEIWLKMALNAIILILISITNRIEMLLIRRYSMFQLFNENTIVKR